MPPLTVALERYERHLPFFDGRAAPPEGCPMTVLEVGQEGEQRHGRHRHERMLREREFDIAEVSLSSYVMAKNRGLPFTAVPVFPRRLFSQTQMFVRADSPITSPSALEGKRVALQSFQTTLAVLAKGDLGSTYGVPLRSVTWHVRASETLPLADGMDARIVRVPREADLAALLAGGEVDALFYSRFPRSPLVPGGTIRRLFPDAEGEALGYYRAQGWFPVMHVLALRQDVADAHPALPQALIRWYEAGLALARKAYDDPAWLYLPFGRLAYETTLAAFGGNPWPAGLAANRAFLARFIDYARDQQLVTGAFGVDALFHPSTAGT
jgi:4,5-dihydroxyphthalate decarboxylase